MWPETAFNKGVEIIGDKPKVTRFFLAINGLDTSINIEDDDTFKDICFENGIINVKRLTYKEDLLKRRTSS